MEINENVYCRLCAELKPTNKCLNLEYDSEPSQDIVQNLTNLSLDFLDISDKKLPKTVCIVCQSALNNTINFINCMEKAQEVLLELFVEQKIKCEFDNFHSDNESVKIESDFVEAEDIVTFIESKPLEEETDKPEAVEEKKQEPEVKQHKLIQKSPSSEFETWEQYSWLCAVCKIPSPTIKELISHAQTWHGKCTVFKCTDCNWRKLKHNAFIAHVTRHREHLKYSCHICFKFCGSNQILSLHLKEHNLFDHICKGCNTTFPSNIELKNHTEKYFPEPVKRTFRTVTEADLICNICKKQLKSLTTLQRHFIQHTERKQEYVCDQCGKAYYNKRSLVDHLNGHVNFRPYKCKICNMEFIRLSKLRAHIGTHEGVKPFSCEKCDKSFRIKRYLLKHMIVHTDLLPHVCTYCKRGFKRKSVLKMHERTHTGEQPYSCDICPRQFTNWPNYNKHMKRVHEIDKATKKHTADGTFPINRVTGEVQMTVNADTEQWKQSIREMSRKNARVHSVV